MGPEETVRRELAAMLPRLRRFALSLTGSTHDADDLVQDTVERALKYARRWQPGTRLDSWLYRIAQNIWIDSLRARKRRPSAPIEDADHVLGMDGQDAAEARLMLLQTMEAMMRLPEEQRVVASLILIEGFGYQETAEILEIPTGTVTSRLARAREALMIRLSGEKP